MKKKRKGISRKKKSFGRMSKGAYHIQDIQRRKREYQELSRQLTCYVVVFYRIQIIIEG